MALGPSGPPPRRRGPLIAVTVATVIAVPFIIRDMVSDDDGATDRAGVTTTTVARSAGSTQPTTTARTSDSVPPVTVPLDPRWVAKGSSRYSDSDEVTESRVSKFNAPSTTAPPATVGLPTTTTKKGSVTTTTKPTVRTTAPPATTAAPPTVPPTTALPPTAPPTTAALTDAAAPGG